MILHKITILLFFFITFFYLLPHSFSQTPIYDLSKHFYVAQASLVNSQNKIASDFTFQVPTGFTISTSTHRRPFHGITTASHIRNEFDENFYFYT